MLKELALLYIHLPQVVDKLSRLKKHAPAQPDQDTVALYHSLMTFDWKWFIFFLIGATLSFGIILFGLLFFRRWGSPHLGYFFVTVVVLVNRIMQPSEMFWQAFGIFTGAICLFMAFHQMREHEYIAGREPAYFLLNSFALVVCSLTSSHYLNGLAAVALFASLFFMTTKNPRKPGKHGKADQYVLESLERRAQRK